MKERKAMMTLLKYLMNKKEQGEEEDNFLSFFFWEI